MNSTFLRTIAQLAAVIFCCLAVASTGCRRSAEVPGEVPAPTEQPQAVQIDSEYFVAYPGAEVDKAGLEQHPTYLTQKVNASTEAVIQFYSDYYTGRGWTKGPVLDRSDLYAVTFLGPDGRVTVSVRSPEGGSRLVGLVYNANR